MRLWYESVERLADIQAELRRQNKRLLRLQRPADPDAVPSHADPQFSDCAGAVVGQTKLGKDRLWILWQAARNVSPLGLPLLEGGSYRGGSAYFLARAVREQLGREVPVEAVDTFEGHPGEKLTDRDHEYHTAGMFSEASFEEAKAFLSEFSQARVHKGEFSAVVPTLPHERYGLVHLDMDLYLPTIEGLRFAAERVPVGGVIVLDDYGARKCPGILAAADEFLAERSGFQSWHPHTEQLVLVRVG